MKKILLCIVTLLLCSALSAADLTGLSGFAHHEYVHVTTSGTVNITFDRWVDGIYVVDKSTYNAYIRWNVHGVDATATNANATILDSGSAGQTFYMPVHTNIMSVCVDHDSGLSQAVDFEIIAVGGKVR